MHMVYTWYAMLLWGSTRMILPISFRINSLAVRQYNCLTANELILKNMGGISYVVYPSTTDDLTVTNKEQ